jgi:hypothetical protein
MPCQGHEQVVAAGIAMAPGEPVREVIMHRDA